MSSYVNCVSLENTTSWDSSDFSRLFASHARATVKSTIDTGCEIIAASGGSVDSSPIHYIYYYIFNTHSLKKKHMDRCFHLQPVVLFFRVHVREPAGKVPGESR